MSTSTAFAGGDAPLSEYLQLQGPSGAAAESYVHKTVFSYAPSTLSDMEHVGQPGLLKAPTVTRPLLRVALMATLFVTVFLVLRCVHHISATSSTSRGIKVRRIADRGWANPCDPTQQEQHPRQQPRQEAAGAAAAQPEAVAGPSSEAGAAAPAQLSTTASAATTKPLDLMTIFDISTRMHAWLAEAEGELSKFTAGNTPERHRFKAMMVEGVEVFGHLQLIPSEEVSKEEWKAFVDTVSRCRTTFERLLGQGKLFLAEDCLKQTSLLNSGLGSASSHLERMHGENPIYPGDPALQTMKILRDIVADAVKLRSGVEKMYSSYPWLQAVGDALKSLSETIQRVDEALQRAADAAAQAWIVYLRGQHEVYKTQRGDKGKLTAEVDAGKKVNEELTYIAGRSPSK